MTPPNFDPDQCLRDLRRQREREQKKSLRRLRRDCRRLELLGVQNVRIEYDGYGDSGSIEGVIATGADNKEIDLPDEVRDMLVGSAEEMLPDGWENNDGAFGQVVLDVAKRKLTREHSWRITDTEYDEQEWTL